MKKIVVVEDYYKTDLRTYPHSVEDNLFPEFNDELSSR